MHRPMDVQYSVLMWNSLKGNHTWPASIRNIPTRESFSPESRSRGGCGTGPDFVVIEPFKNTISNWNWDIKLNEAAVPKNNQEVYAKLTSTIHYSLSTLHYWPPFRWIFVCYPAFVQLCKRLNIYTHLPRQSCHEENKELDRLWVMRHRMASP